MFVRTKKSGRYTYLQVVENQWRKGKVRQRVLGTLGRMDHLREGEKLVQLLRSTAKFVDDSLIVSPAAQDQKLTIRPQRVGYVLVFGQLWAETGCKAVLRALSEERSAGFPVERALFLMVIHRLTDFGGICSPDQWRRDYRMGGIASLTPDHLHQALVWLGEGTGETPSTVNAARFMKERIEEGLFRRRREATKGMETVRVFASSLSLDAAKRAPDELAPGADLAPVRQHMVLAVAIDQTGRLICSETWPLPEIDGPLLRPLIERLRERFQARRIGLVCDEDAIGTAARDAGGIDEITILQPNGADSASRETNHLRLFPTIRHVFEAAAPLPAPPPENDHWPALLRGHLFCSHLALILRGALEDRLEAAGYYFEWSDILHDLDHLIEVDLEQDTKKFTLSTAADGTCGKVFEAVGVALPRSPESFGVQAPQGSPTPSPVE
jgi:hypothetical protein|tara:strand:+ start:2440 stop:3759 length:1320 start_codon:yes stop_codon:yes gene_type:complete